MRLHLRVLRGEQRRDGALDVDAIDDLLVGQPRLVDGREVKERLAAVERLLHRGEVGDVARDALDRQAVEVAGSRPAR